MPEPIHKTAEILLQDRVVLVTGAGRGFGWGIAQAFASAGSKVAITDIEQHDVDSAVEHARSAGHEVGGWILDVSDEAAFHSVVAAVIDRWGRIDVLVHNAIYMPLVSFEDTSTDSWWRQLHVSLGGLYYGCKAVWPTMVRQRGGHIIGIASGSSLRGYVDEVTYCAGKHGQEGFVKALALEARVRNVAINTVGPGKLIKPTRMTWEELASVPESQRQAWHDPVDLGRAFVWLASQPHERFSGFRFDAGPIVDTLDAEGADFVFAPEKVTLYAEDFRAREAWYRENP